MIYSPSRKKGSSSDRERGCLITASGAVMYISIPIVKLELHGVCHKPARLLAISLCVSRYHPSALLVLHIRDANIRLTHRAADRRPRAAASREILRAIA